MHFYKKCALTLLSVLLIASVGCYPARAAQAASAVRFDCGEWILLEQVSGCSSVEITDTSVSASIGTLLCPGANGVLCIDIVNDGQQSVDISIADSVLRSEVPIQIELSGDLFMNGSTALAPGEKCCLYATVRWDPESAATDVDVDGNFAITLSYEGDEAVIGTAAGESPQTGRDFPAVYIVFATVSLMALLMILLKKQNRTIDT